MQSEVFQSIKKKVKMVKPDSMQNFHHKKCLRQNIAYGKNVFGEKNPFLKFCLHNKPWLARGYTYTGLGKVKTNIISKMKTSLCI